LWTRIHADFHECRQEYSRNLVSIKKILPEKICGTSDPLKALIEELDALVSIRQLPLLNRRIRRSEILVLSRPK
jgi:hypothetical protein